MKCLANIVESQINVLDIDHSYDDMDTKDAVKATVLVHIDKIIQDEFLGANATYHAFALTPENIERGMSIRDLETELSRVKKIDLKIARTWYRPDWSEPEEDQYNWESSYMKALCHWLQCMKDLKVDVALQAGWWFETDTWQPFGRKKTDPVRDIPRYTDWVSRSLAYLIKEKGYDNIKYLILFTEPTTAVNAYVPEGYTSREYYVEVIKALNKRLINDGLRKLVKFVGPNNSHNAIDIDYMCEKLGDIIDIFSGHNYNMPLYEEWKDLCDYMQTTATRVGKPVWLDEYGMQEEEYRLKPEYGNYLAQVVAASINAGNQTSMIWILFDQLYTKPGNHTTNNDSFYDGVQRWGTCRYPHDVIKDAGKTYASWYAFSMMSRFLGGRSGTKAVATTSSQDVVIAATKPDGIEYSFLLINKMDSYRRVEVKLSLTLNINLFRYLYDPSKVTDGGDDRMLPCSKILNDVGSVFTAVLPPKGFAIYTTINRTVNG